MRDETRRKTSGIRLNEEELERLQQAAEVLGVSQAELMRQAIRFALGMPSTVTGPVRLEGAKPKRKT